VHSSRAILTALLLSWITATGSAQDEDSVRKNAISVSILPLFDRTISISYARRLDNNLELTINPRFQRALSNVATEPATDQGTNRRILVNIPDPLWFYNHYQLRLGLRIPISNKFGYEPQLQLGYGSFFNKVIRTDDSEGDAFDEYLRLDRTYYSAGILNTVNWVTDFNRVRIKWFAGVGAHLRLYREMQYNHYIWHRNDNNFQAHEESYSRAHFTLHAGLEVGYRF
jgi:hypothetical protein